VPQVAATISSEDEAAPDLFLSLLEMDIEEDHRMSASFRIKVAISRQDDGLWTLLEDERQKQIGCSFIFDRDCGSHLRHVVLLLDGLGRRGYGFVCPPGESSCWPVHHG